MKRGINVRDLIEDAINDPESRVYMCSTRIMCLDKSGNDGTWKVRSYRRELGDVDVCYIISSQAFTDFSKALHRFFRFVA